jgi:ABC transporter/Oligopeptide/dipeptide transporter, C-terminal region
MVKSVYFPGVRGPEWHAKVESALDSVALNPADVVNKFPHQLSGGQQQRLLIARALLLDVHLLVADEIISMLDASTRVDVLNLLVHLKKLGLGVLFITHDLSLGNYISDRSVILRYGAVVEMGGTQQVFGNPQHAYTKSLLAAVPQLHKKWEAGGVGALVATGGTNGANGAYGSNAPGDALRYSQSSLNPLRVTGAASSAQGPGRGAPAPSQTTGPQPGERQPGERQPGARPSLMDLEDAPWQRSRPQVNRLGAVLAANPAPKLVEVEQDHFVAVDGE